VIGYAGEDFEYEREQEQENLDETKGVEDVDHVFFFKADGVRTEAEAREELEPDRVIEDLE